MSKDTLSNASSVAERARRESLAHYGMKLRPGDLVVEVTGLSRRTDPDSIGYLLGYGEAPYNEDGTGATREVWDVVPLTLATGAKGLPYQRWENATFRRTFMPIPLRLRLRAKLRYWRVSRWYE